MGVLPRVLGALGRVNGRHPWSHNDAFSAWVLGHARAVRRDGGARALDVGCGTGNLVRRLARVMPRVDALEPDAATAAIARRSTASLPNVEIRVAPFPGPGGRYDLITFVASLHHLPLRETLEAASDMLAPGGRLVVVGLARGTPRDLPLELASTLLNPIVGLIRHPRPAAARPESMSTPVAPAIHTIEEIRAVALGVLPGAVVRRRLFWRYTLVWRSPRRGDGLD